MIWLDMLIFGNGKGLGAPYWDQRFYWLCDNLTQKSNFYTWIGGLGAQLHSFSWFHPKAGTEIHVSGERLRIFRSTRRWLRVQCSWAMVDLPEEFEASRNVRARFQSRLGTGPYTERLP